MTATTTIDTQTPITTAARRIVRELNATRPAITLAFDREGRQTDAWSTGMYYTSPQTHYVLAHCGALGGLPPWYRDRYSLRGIQDELDAIAYADAHPDQPDAAEWYALELDAARLVGRYDR